MSSLTPLTRASGQTVARQLASKAVTLPIVQAGIKNLLLAFPAGSPQHPDDRVQQLRIYAAACHGFEAGVVDYVFRRLVFHNSRNPFPPTPQDIFELCKQTAQTATLMAARYRLLHTYRLASVDKLDDLAVNYWNAEFGPPPDTEACIVSDNAILDEVRKQIVHHQRKLIDLAEDHFLSIPTEAFPDGFHDQIVKKRAQKAYELSLSVDERAAREAVVYSLRYSERDLIGEEEIRRRTAERLRSEQAKKGRDLP